MLARRGYTTHHREAETLALVYGSKASWEFPSRTPAADRASCASDIGGFSNSQHSERLRRLVLLDYVEFRKVHKPTYEAYQHLRPYVPHYGSRPHRLGTLRRRPVQHEGAAVKVTVLDNGIERDASPEEPTVVKAWAYVAARFALALLPRYSFRSRTWLA